MVRTFFMLFALVAYAIFLATFLYLIAFVGDLPWAPSTVDRGPISDLMTAFVTDIVLIALFGAQHSVMARRWFKEAWTKIVPVSIERSVFVLFTSIVLIVLFAFWRPIPGELWRIDNPAGAAIVWALFAAGWLIVLLSTFLINHFELFGLTQVYHHWRGASAADPQFHQPFLYRIVRHPLYSGFFIALWATPAMSYGHLVLALGMSVYILIAIRHEERDLVHLFGADYEDYRQRVGMLTPRIVRRTR